MKKAVRLNNFLLFIFILTLLSSCSTVPFYSPFTSTSSEVTGGGVQTGITYMSGYSMEFSDNLLETDITHHQQFKEKKDIQLNLSLGLTENIDVETNGGAGVPYYLGGKWQIYGDSFAKAGGGSFSISLKFGANIYITGGESTPEGVQERKFLINGWRMPFELSAGYRVLDMYLIYLGFGFSEFNYILDWRERRNDETDIEFQGEHSWITIGNGLKFEKFSALFALSFDSIEITENPDENRDDLNFALTLAYLF